MRRGALFVVALAIGGCGLDESGIVGPDASGDTSLAEASFDAPSDVPEEPVVCADAGPASCVDAAGFGSPTLYSPDAAAPCPAGYATHDLVLATPDAPNCGCNCADAGAPSCDTSVIDYAYGITVGCLVGSGSVPLSGACTAVDEGTFATENLQVGTPAVIGGCTGGTPVAPPSTNASARLCVPDCASDESVCAAQGALEACVYAASDAPSCPANYPKGPFYVGATPQVTCDACSCSPAGDCSGSTAHLYTDTQCGAGNQSFPMDGQCHAVPAGAIGNFHSANVKPSLKSYQCKVTPGASHVTYGGESFTVCCK